MFAGVANIDFGLAINILYLGATGIVAGSGTTILANTPYVLSGNPISGSPAHNWANGAQSPASLSPTVNASKALTVLGSRGASALSNNVLVNGWVAEYVVTSPVLSDANRRIIEADQGQYYGITVATLPVTPVLGTPTVTDTTISLTWTMSSDTGVTDYIVEYKASSSGTWLVFSDSTSTAKSATITGLTSSTSYDTRVKAVTGAGSGDYSNTQTISTESGQNNHLVQATGSRQPTYDGTAKSINFDGGDWLDRASFGMFNNGSATCFAVTSDRVIVNADTLFAETGTLDFYTFQRLTGSGNTTTQIRVNAVTLLNDVPLNGTNTVPTTKHIQTYKDTGSIITYYENGVAGTTPQSYTRLTSATMDRFALGGRILAGADDRTIQAKVYELLIYFGALSNSDINLIGNYLNTKWSASWTNL